MDTTKEAYRTIRDAIRERYPESPEDNEDPQLDFRWGMGDGFILSLEGLLRAALGSRWDREAD